MQKIFFVLSLSILTAAGVTRVFTGPYMVYDAGVPIDVGYYGAPVMSDWDGDGKKDLICGQFDLGKIRFYRNIAEDTAPLFNGYVFLRADGVEITLPYG